MVVPENYLSVSSHALTTCVLNPHFPAKTAILHAECILKIKHFNFRWRLIPYLRFPLRWDLSAEVKKKKSVWTVDFPCAQVDQESF